MKTINNCLVDYITACRTIETINLEGIDKVFYVYNYEGNHFRLFTDVLGLVKFFEFGLEPKYSFLTETELESFIEANAEI
jgi:hypothetical protein